MTRAVLVASTASLWLGIAAWTAQATTYNCPPDPIPSTVSEGDIVNLGAGATWGVTNPAQPTVGNVTFNFNGGAASYGFHTFAGSTVNIYQGTIDAFSQNVGSIWNLYEGNIGVTPSFYSDATLNMFGGVLAYDHTFNMATVNLHGGKIEGSGTIAAWTTLTMTGGEMGEFSTFESTFNLSGGVFNGRLQMMDSYFNLTVQTALLDGQPIALSNGVPHTVTERDMTLSGILLDGSHYSIPLGNPSNVGANLNFVSESTLVQITKIPEPVSLGLALPAFAFVAARRRMMAARRQ